MWEENWTMLSHLMILEMKVRYFFSMLRKLQHLIIMEKRKTILKGYVSVDLGKLSSRVEGVILFDKTTITKTGKYKEINLAVFILYIKAELVHLSYQLESRI